LGVLLGLGGVFCMAFLDTVVEKYKMKSEIKKAKLHESQNQGDETPKAK